MYRLRYEKRVFKDLDRIPDNYVIRIDRSIQALRQNPLPMGTKKLVGERNLYRIRQGDYRIIYTIDHRSKEVKILGVRHRKESYRRV